MDINDISGEIVSAAVSVHSEIGPSHLESAYAACLQYELRLRGLNVRTQVNMPLIYRGIDMGVTYRLDLLVENAVIVELKAVPRVLHVHESQLLAYLRLSGHTLGLLLNFHAPRMKDGIIRKVNGL
jgi:GxxExxY protein